MWNWNQIRLVVLTCAVAGQLAMAAHTVGAGRWITIPGESVGQPNSTCSYWRPEMLVASAEKPVAKPPPTVKAAPSVPTPSVPPPKAEPQPEPVPKGYTSKTPTDYCTTSVSEWGFPVQCGCEGAPWKYNKKNGLCMARYCSPEETPGRFDCLNRKPGSQK